MALHKDFILSKFNPPIVVGISGVATSGKDTFYSLLKEYLENYGLKVQRFALADKLKEELDSFLISNYGISSWTKNPDEKKLIRPVLVAHGGVKRFLSKGQYWTNQVSPLIEDALKNNIIPVITDIRYAEYEQDEVFWLKKYNGKLAYISRYLGENEEKKFVEPPNEDERRNDPALRKSASKIIEWKTVINPNLENLGKYVESFIEAL